MCVDGKFLNLEKPPGKQVVSIAFPTKEGGMENLSTRKRDSKGTVETYYTGWDDQRGKRQNEWSG